VRVIAGVIAVLVVVALVAVTAGIGIVAWTTSRAFAGTTGTLRLAGLTAPVSVTRDMNGLVRIVADTPADLFRAQGYVHASERMWQMEVWRHISAGRLAELFGSSQVDTDRFIRTLGWRQAAQRDLDAASPVAKAALEAYADGVNAYLDEHRGRLGMPFVVVGSLAGTGAGLDGYTPEPWQPIDSIAWGKVQAWSLGGDYESELFRALAVKGGLDPATLEKLFPPYPSGAPVIVPTGTPGSGGAGATAHAVSPSGGGTAAAASTARDDARTATIPRAATPSGDVSAWLRVAGIGRAIPAIAGLGVERQLGGGSGIGSNDWVVAPSLSATGSALLANDPHLAQSAPSIWYVNTLACRVVSPSCPYDVSGASFPGVPGVVIGHNARIAWGVTNVNPDVQDLFRETVDPADPSRYLTPDGSAAFTTRTETISVAGGDPVTLTIRETRHGPVLNDVVDDLRDSTDVYALQWTATDRPDGLLDSFLAVDRAAGWDDFRAALSTYGAPSQNFVYADVDGHIGYQMPGWVPIRARVDPDGLPADGASGAGDWIGTVSFDDLPRLFDPPAGMIVTANNAVVDDRYPYHLGRSWDPGWRAARIAQLLTVAAVRDGVTTDEIAAIQGDTVVTRAADLIRWLPAARPQTADGSTVMQRIAAFDGRCTPDSKGCAAYETFEYALLRYVFDDDLGALARDYVGTDASRVAIRRLLTTPDDPLWDRAETPRRETRDLMLGMALDQAGRLLRDELGDTHAWSWARLRSISWDEQTLGSSGTPGFGWYFNVGPAAAPGTADAVNNTAYAMRAGYPDPAEPGSTGGGLREVFATTYAPSVRLIVDVGDFDRTRVIHAPGQSGVPFSRHYSDLVDDWLAGRYVRLPFTDRAAGAAATERLTLTP
jgi:penicillin G amidase